MFLLLDSTHRMLMRYHPRVGYMHVPQLVARVPHESGGYLVRTNSAGFRSDLEFEEGMGERPRILVFGDSFTAGEGCESQQRYPELVGQALGAEVFNYGLSGSGPDQHVLLYKEFAKQVEADLIIWGISIHNIERAKMTHRPSTDRVSGKPVLVPKPYFTLDNGVLNLHHVPVPRTRVNLRADDENQYSEDGDFNTPIVERLLKSSALEKVREFIQRSVPHLKDRIRAIVYRIAGVQIYDDYLHDDSPGWLLLSALIKQFRAEVNYIPILIVPLPTYHYYIDRLRPVYQDLFESLEDSDSGLFVCNITDGLHDGKTLAERKSICFPTDAHYSPYGHQEIARLIAQEVWRRRLLPNRKNSAEGIVSITSVESTTGRYVLGLAFGAADSAAALVRDGEVVATARESSFTRVEDQGGLPHLAANYCLEEALINQSDLSAVVYGGAPSSELKRDALSLLSTPNKDAWCQKMATWVLHDLNSYPAIRDGLRYDGRLLESGYSTAQCAGAFYASPYTAAAIISFHGHKQRAATSIAIGGNEGLKLLKESPAPHSLQTFHAAMLRFITGRKVGAEAQLWALAQTGEADFADRILDELVDLKIDGSFGLNPDYFADSMDSAATDNALARLFKTGQAGEHEFGSHGPNLARSVQLVCCEAIVRTARYARDLTGETKLCMSGSPILDPEVRRALLDDGCFNEVWVQSITGNANAALGAALAASFEHFDVDRSANLSQVFRGTFGLLGPEFSSEEIDAFVDTYDYPSVVMDSEAQAERLAAILAQGKMVGHFSGRLGAAPECVGDRLILVDPRSGSEASIDDPAIIGGEPDLVPTIAVPELAAENGVEPYHQFKLPNGDVKWARVIDKGMSPYSFEIIREFEAQTGSNVVLSAALKLPGEAVACTPLDAYRCFMQSNMDVLVLGNRLLEKEEQPPWQGRAVESSGRVNGRDRFLDSKLFDGLDQVYEKKCKTAVRRTRDVDDTGSSLQFKVALSYWSVCAETDAGQSVSEVSAEMELVNPSPRVLAEAVINTWDSESLKAQVRPILIRLARLRRRLVSRGLR